MPAPIVVGLSIIAAILVMALYLLYLEERAAERERSEAEATERRRRWKKAERRRIKAEAAERRRQEDPIWQAQEGQRRANEAKEECTRIDALIAELEADEQRRKATYRRELAGYTIKDIQMYYIIACDIADEDKALFRPTREETLIRIVPLREQIAIAAQGVSGLQAIEASLLARLSQLETALCKGIVRCPNPGCPSPELIRSQLLLPKWDEVENL